MAQILHRVLIILVLAGLLLATLQFDISVAVGMDPERRRSLTTQCVDRIEKWFPLITIQTLELDLEHAKLARQENYLAIIPLKKSHGNVRSIRWHSKDHGEILSFIRLLQQGKIGALNVSPLLYDPGSFHVDHDNFLDEMRGCQQKEQVQEVLGLCKECVVYEWLDIKQ